MKNRLFPWALLGFLCLLLAPASRAERLPGEYLHEIKVGGYETPHIPWAKPYAQGKVKVFSLTPFTAAAREVTELWQRMDVEVFGETTIESGTLGREDGCFPDVQETRTEEKTARLRRKLQEQRYDVFVCANFLFGTLSTELKYRLLEQVAQGAGLVFVYPHEAPPELFEHPTDDGRAEITAGVPFAGLPFFTALDPAQVVRTYTFHQGRIAQVDYGVTCPIRPCNGGPGLTPFEPFTFETPTCYDYYHSLIIRTILWAAGKLPQVRFGGLPAEGLTVEYAARPFEVPLTLHSELDANLPAQMSATLRNVWGEVEFSAGWEMTVQPGDNALPLRLLPIKGGGHFVDLILTSARGKENWASFFVRVQPPVAIDRIELAQPISPPPRGRSLATSATAARRVAEVARLQASATAARRVAEVARLQASATAARGRVVFDRPVPGDGYRLQVQLWDNYGRLFAQREEPLPAGAASAAFELPLTHAVSLCGRARARLLPPPPQGWGGLRGGGAEGATTAGVEVQPGEAILDQREQTFLVPGRQPPRPERGLGSPERHDYPAVIWGRMPGILGHYAQQRLREAGFSAVLTNPDAATASQLALDDLRLVPYCTRVGASGSFTDEKARQQLAERMRQIAAELKDYEPLVYSLGDECYIPADFGFKPEDQPAFRDYLRRKYGTLDALNAAWETKLSSWDEAETIALSAAQLEGPRRAGRFVQYHDTESFREARYAEMFRFLRDAIREVDPDARVGAEGSEPGDLEETIRTLEFWGPYRDPRGNALLRSLAPRDLVRGNWFGGYRSQRYDPLTLPTFLWDALLDGNNLIEYFAVNTLEGIFNTDFSWAYWTERFWDDFQWIVDGLGQLIAASEYDYDGVALHHSPACWHASALTGGLTEATAAHEGFLALLNDLGLQHFYLSNRGLEAGRLRSRWIQVFLLPFSQALSAKEVQELRAFVERGGLLIADGRPGVMDGDCRPLEKGQLDDLLGVQQLNFPLNSYLTARQSGDPQPFLETFRRLIAPAVQPQARVVDGSGRPLAPVRLVRFRRGSARLWGVLWRGHPSSPPHAKGGTEGVLKLSRPAWVYGLRERKRFGWTDTVPLRLEPGHANLYALLPYPVEGLRLDAPARVQAGEPVPVAIKLMVPAKARPSGHLLRLNVFGPDGQRRRFYAQTLYPEGAECETFVPLALNDAAGVWRIQVRDVLTGCEATAKVEWIQAAQAVNG